ncbi:LOW QUALITY PROTEIN: chaperone protein dnaJ 11, chloroplastic [Cryptomeria japonica]|uniref:LOW QUALITY PROTEIN: chaperone protein dnaJ 11, chloroplastic n=1 Tax=Cryptomeria japonica TaxID=3369 RepID=UPI0027D9E103|nr:LOW QUALITY PROTEIN: chaperone protein dnaJ 11, chloroplastic [Cryptomeria japonica]
MNSLAVSPCERFVQELSLSKNPCSGSITSARNFRSKNYVKYGRICSRRIGSILSAARTAAAPREGCSEGARAGNLYEILGVSTRACAEEIKAAYRKLARRFHPDAASSDAKVTSARKFLCIHDAYALLSDPEARAEYDRRLSARPQFLTYGNGYARVYQEEPLYRYAVCNYRKGRNWESDQCW